MARYVDPGCRIVCWHDETVGGYDHGHESHVVFFRTRDAAKKFMARRAKQGWKWADFVDQHTAEMYFGLPHHARTEGRKVALPKRKREVVAA